METYDLFDHIKALPRVFNKDDIYGRQTKHRRTLREGGSENYNPQ